MSDDDVAISYRVLQPGTAVADASGTPVGTVRQVLDNEREEIFDGLVVDTPDGRRYVDAPEVGRITEQRVTLTLTAAEVAALPAQDPKGGTTFEANTARRRFGRLWRKS